MVNLCSSSTSGNEDLALSPVKPKTTTGCTTPTDVIRQLIPNVTDDYHDPITRQLPILARPSEGLDVNQLFTLMIGTVPPNRICYRKPTSITYSSVFVIDLSSVHCIDDLRADDNGVWTHGGKPRKKYNIEFDPDTHEVISAVAVTDNTSTEDKNQFTLVRIYHHHQSTPTFHRRISYVIDDEGKTVQYAVVQYLFSDGNEIPVVLLPHGNAKRVSSSYRRTQKSTLSKMKKTAGKPKDVISKVFDEAGGMLGASSSSEIPRNRRQIYNIQHSSLSHGSIGTSGKPDPIFELLQQCKMDLTPGGRKFIRSVNFETSPSCVIATDAQLQNVVRFCTNQGPHCILGIDPTFNLGKFYVTITTFVYTHVVKKGTMEAPTFFGPMFIHTEKNFESYHYFFSTLLKMEPKLANIIAVGTDGEQAITKALRAVFGERFIHLRCFIHMKDNIQRKLGEFLLPERIRNEIIRDLFGFQQDTVYVKGILDAESVTDFDLRLSHLKSKWDGLEQSVHSEKDPQVHDWILKNVSAVMKECMIAPIRESAGLGSPPRIYTTNRNECMNHVAKAHMDHRKSS